ncbi:hypothetical protein C8Q70DRAFT_1057640 [Cubamyces menziesii]|uniref:Pentatricopeptide repeat-containing protein n=1 Tax=Trametes cubensis TaxID=1111947 RepID=A0AAD7TLY9_9APHY|nr:hypothetical protein C8Q70DRAFT_1057640 [Cubamyces menziesii]KAJ8469251.1 hypothetical protein ONZ51_g9123 [Trametes cubensis]
MCPHHPSKPSKKPKPPLQRPKPDVEQVCTSVARKLADDNPSAAAAIVHRALDRAGLSNPSRFRLFEHSVASFLRYGDVMKAAMLYSRMTREGYIPSVSLRVQMHVVKLAQLPATEDELLEIAGDACRNRTFDEAALRDLLRTLVEGLKASPRLVQQVVNRFLETREQGYKLSNDTVAYLMQVYGKAGDKETAKQWSEYTSGSPTPTTESSALDPVLHPYTTLLRDLAASKPSFSVYKWTLERMQQDNVQPDLPFFNALLSHEVAQRNYDVVFALYRLLMEKRTAAAMPQAQTFAPVFRAIHRLSCSHRYRRTHGIRVPADMPSARSVYKDMLTCHIEATRGRPSKPSPVLDATVLHRALRTFVARHDYAAAYTAVRAFRLFPHAVGAPTMATYRIVFGSLLGRIRVQFPRMAARLAAGIEPDTLWTYRFLGVGDLGARDLAQLAMDVSMVHRVLHVGTDARLSCDFIVAPAYARPQAAGHLGLLDDFSESESERLERLSAPREFHAHGMPSPLEFSDLKPVPEGQAYAVVPLERVLRRAIAASCPSDGPLARQVSEEIVKAKNEMVVKW